MVTKCGYEWMVRNEVLGFLTVECFFKQCGAWEETEGDCSFQGRRINTDVVIRFPGGRHKVVQAAITLQWMKASCQDTSLCQDTTYNGQI